MATKKAKPAKTAEIVKRKSNSIVSIQDMLRKQAEAMGEKTAPATGTSIRVTQDKQFVLPDGTKTNGPIEVVILDFVSYNAYYDRPFDSNDPMPPACFAIGTDPKKMIPSKNSPDRQSDECNGCPMNQFGSNGKGKACGNHRLLAVLPPDADEDTPIWTLRTSPTAIKGFDGYVSQLARLKGLPPIGVITEISFDDSSSYSTLTFGKPRPYEAVAEFLDRQAEAQEILMREPDVTGYEAPKAVRGRRR